MKLSGKLFPICLFIPLVGSINLFAQDLTFSKSIIQELCSEKYQGRGYVNNGVNVAADFLSSEFSSIGARKFGYSYFQPYSFSVNTHEKPISCFIDNTRMEVGKDFLVSAGAQSAQGIFSLLHFNTIDSLDKELLLKKIKIGFDSSEALVLHNSKSRANPFIDSCIAYSHIPQLVIFTEEKKLTHTIATQLDKYNSLVFLDSCVANKDQIQISFQNTFLPNAENKNIVAYIKGRKSDSTIVFSAHYDHLGMQYQAMFPGASDNASGCSMVLYLAKYFTKHKPPCNVVFILFSGEEAGLLGSQFFTSHPLFNIQKIKMLINIDIMGSAKDGITVVNGELFKEKFNLLSNINLTKQYLPEVRIRGKAKNSDHYYFSEKGIPSFFIYSMGGPGFYHDIFDKAETLPLDNYENVVHLLIDFIFQI